MAYQASTKPATTGARIETDVMTETLDAEWEWPRRGRSTRINADRRRPISSRLGERNEHGRIYGGQLLGQAIMAASRTVPDDRAATYLRFLFAAGGVPEQAVDYEVDPAARRQAFCLAKRAWRPAGRPHSLRRKRQFRALHGSPSHAAPPEKNSGLESDPESLPGLEDIDAAEVRDVERTLNYGYREHPAIDLRLPFVEDVLRGDPRCRARGSGSACVRPCATIRRCTPRPSPTSPIIGSTSSPASRMCARWRKRIASSMSRASITRSGFIVRFAPSMVVVRLREPARRARPWAGEARVYSPRASSVASATQECLLSPM